MIKNQLIKIREAKKVIRENKIGIKKYFEDKYPVLTKESLYQLEQNIRTGLEVLLSSSLKFKTTRIKIPVPLNKYNDCVTLQRKPGLNYPHYSYGEELFDQEHQSLLLNKNHDFVWSKEHYDKAEHGKIALKFSVLKNHELVDQNKLKLVIKLRKKAVRAQKESKKILDITRFHGNRSSLDISKNLMIDIDSKGFEIGIKFNKERYETNKSYADLASFDYNCLKLLVKDWSLLETSLTELENKKQRMIRDYKQILKELGNANRAYLILQKLI